MITKRTIAAAGLVLATALGGFIGTADAAPAPVAKKTTLGSITATPSTNLKDLQKVKVTVSGFGTYSGPVTVVQCTPSVIQDGTHPAKYCDTKNVKKITISHGRGTSTFNVRAKSFHATAGPTQKCKKGGSCLILATTSAKNPLYAAFSQISFAR